MTKPTPFTVRYRIRKEGSGKSRKGSLSKSDCSSNRKFSSSSTSIIQTLSFSS